VTEFQAFMDSYRLMLARAEKAYLLGSVSSCAWQEHCSGTLRSDANVIVITMVINSMEQRSSCSHSPGLEVPCFHGTWRSITYLQEPATEPCCSGHSKESIWVQGFL